MARSGSATRACSPLPLRDALPICRSRGRVRPDHAALPLQCCLETASCLPCTQQRSGCSLGSGIFLDQTSDGRRHLCALLDPVVDAILSQTQVLDAILADGVVKAQTFNETTIATVARVSSNNIVEGALLRAAAGQTNYNHGNPLRVL